MTVTTLGPATATPAPFGVPLRRGRAAELVVADTLAPVAGDREQFLAAWRKHETLILPGDAVTVFASAAFAAQVFFELPPGISMRAVRGGRDALDRAVRAEWDAHHYASRYEWVVVAGQTPSFAPIALEARQAGLLVWSVNGAPLDTAGQRIAHVHSTLKTSAVRPFALAA